VRLEKTLNSEKGLKKDQESLRKQMKKNNNKKRRKLLKTAEDPLSCDLESSNKL